MKDSELQVRPPSLPKPNNVDIDAATDGLCKLLQNTVPGADETIQLNGAETVAQLQRQNNTRAAVEWSLYFAVQAGYLEPMLREIGLPYVLPRSHQPSLNVAPFRRSEPTVPRFPSGKAFASEKPGQPFAHLVLRLSESGRAMIASGLRPHGITDGAQTVIVEGHQESVEQSSSGAEAGSARNRRVFVVHGHDSGRMAEVARMLMGLHLDPVILHEQSSGGRTIIEKLEFYDDVGFAVVLLTADDVGAAKGTATTKRRKFSARARQNVILELGYFIGNLGRANVCALCESSVEKPSDFDGVVYVALDKAGAWKMELARELQAAGYEIDFANIR